MQSTKQPIKPTILQQDVLEKVGVAIRNKAKGMMPEEAKEMLKKSEQLAKEKQKYEEELQTQVLSKIEGNIPPQYQNQYQEAKKLA